MANTHRYGFRFLKNRWGGDTPEVQTHFISSGYAANTGANGSGGTACALNIGDPVQLVETSTNTAGAGSIRLAPAGTGDTDTGTQRVYGIVVGFPQMLVSGAKRPNAVYPVGGVTYSADVNKTLVAVIPVEGAVWEVDVDTTSASFDTIGEYEAVIGQNCNYNFTTTLTVSTSNVKANPLATLSFTATAATIRQLRILGVGRLGDNIDFASASVPLQVLFNTVQTSPFRTEGGLNAA
jgi:hypothetical protein